MSFKKYRLVDIFTIKPTKKLHIEGKAYIQDKDIIDENGRVPYIVATSRNNGIGGYSNYTPMNVGGCITLSTTADSSNTVFYRNCDFIGRQQIAEIRRKDGRYISEGCGLYLVTLFRKLTQGFNYANKLTIPYLEKCEVILPTNKVNKPNFAKLAQILEENGGAM